MELAKPSSLDMVLLCRSSPDQFGNTNMLITRHMAQPMAMVKIRSCAMPQTSSMR